MRKDLDVFFFLVYNGTLYCMSKENEFVHDGSGSKKSRQNHSITCISWQFNLNFSIFSSFAHWFDCVDLFLRVFFSLPIPSVRKPSFFHSRSQSQSHGLSSAFRHYNVLHHANAISFYPMLG